MTVDPMVRARPYCPGCGYHYADHRADCTTHEMCRALHISEPTERTTP